ncbi:MAG: flagellar motor switch protein FliG [Candidatus Caenarcaniphilales bacterium]|jgi:flagellar motor switch protein FliG|nr:flagellar motor switch protein FliG [Candidatus Caenarcaniphilales bacterium]
MAKTQTSIKSWSKRMKVAALLVLMDQDAAAGVLRSFDDDHEVIALAKEISMVGTLSESDQEILLNEMYDALQIQKGVASGGLDLAETMLVEAYGQDGANEIIDKMTNTIQRVPFEFLRIVDAEQISTTIQHEHPQVITLLLSHLKIEKAAQVLQNLPENIRSDIALRLARMDRTNPEILSVVERILERRFAGVMSQGEVQTTASGVEALAEILNRVDRNTEKRILEDLEGVDQVLATDIRNLMFVFEDIIRLDDKSIQRLLRDVDSRDLSLALKGANENIREIFFRNMSEKAAKLMRDDIEMMGPVLMKDVSEVQTKIVGIVRSLEQAGEIIIMGNSDEDMFIE